MFDAAVEAVDEQFGRCGRRGEVAKVVQGLAQLGVRVEDMPAMAAGPPAVGELDCPEKPAHGRTLLAPRSRPKRTMGEDQQARGRLPRWPNGMAAGSRSSPVTGMATHAASGNPDSST